MTQRNNQAPHPIKAGRGIRAKVWRNQNETSQWFNVEIVRTYVDDDGQFQDSSRFSRDDLLHVAYAAQQAFAYILQQNDDSDPGIEF